MAKPLVRNTASKPSLAAAKSVQKPAPRQPIQEDTDEQDDPQVPATRNTETTVAKSVADRMARAAGKGATENMDAKDYAIPFIKILDKNSGQTVEASDNYVSGARPGMIFNTVSKELFDGKEGITVIPCGFKSVILEWESVEPGSGFIAEHPASSDIKTTSGGSIQEVAGGAKRFVMPNGHCLQDANNYYVLLVKEDGDTDRVIISMTGSNLTQSRLWNSMMADRKMVINGRKMKAPTYGVQYQLTSKPMTDGKFHWHVWNIIDAGLIDDDNLFDQAESFYETVIEGLVKGNYSASAPEPDAAQGDGNRDHQEASGDDIPY